MTGTGTMTGTGNMTGGAADLVSGLPTRNGFRAEGAMPAGRADTRRPAIAPPGSA